MPQQDDERDPGPYLPSPPAEDQSRPQAPAANPTQPLAGSPAAAQVSGQVPAPGAPQLPGGQQPHGTPGDNPAQGWGAPEGAAGRQGYGGPQGYGAPQPTTAHTEPTQSGTWGSPAGVALTPDGTRRPTAMWKKVAGGVALAAVVAVGGVAAVNAANASNTPSGQTGQGGLASSAGGYGQGFGSGGTDTGRRGGIGSLGDALHGEFVVATESGGTETRRLQRGQVTAVGSGSLSVTSTDNFAATYTVGSGVDVSGIAVGNTVTVIATVDGAAVTAVTVTAGSEFGGMPQGGAGRTDDNFGEQGPMGAPGGTPPEGTAPQGGTAPTTQAPQTS